MRNQLAVDLGEGRLALVRELRVADVRLLLGRAKDLQALAERPLHEALGVVGPDLLALIGDGLVLPEGMTLDDLAMSEVLAIKAKWLELHADFFAQLGALARMAGTLPAAISTGPVSSASSAGTPPSGPTAGRPSRHSSK
jgi:hypothetical protein